MGRCSRYIRSSDVQLYWDERFGQQEMWVDVNLFLSCVIEKVPISLSFKFLISAYLMRKAFDDFLFWLMPNFWLPLYNSVSFTHMPYKQCIENRAWQDRILNKSLKFCGFVGACAVALGAFCFVKDSNFKLSYFYWYGSLTRRNSLLYHGLKKNLSQLKKKLYFLFNWSFSFEEIF